MILEQTMAEDELTLSAAQMYALFPPPKDNANIQGCTAMLLQGEKISRNSWADFLRHSMALDEKGCASSRAWVPVHTTTTVNHYAATMAAFAFFCNKLSASEYPLSMSMPDLFFKALSEPKRGLKCQFIVRQFFSFSYLSMGRGNRSKQSSFIVQEAVALLYAFKIAYLIFASNLPDIESSVTSSVAMAKRFLNQASDAETSFKSVKRIKNQAKSCIASWSVTPITWVRGSELYTSLTVDTDKGKIPVSHAVLLQTFSSLLGESSAMFNFLGIPALSNDQYSAIKDPISQFQNEGLASFNPSLFTSSAQQVLFDRILIQDKVSEFLTACSSLGLTLMCAMHLAGGPGARAAEECFFSVRNTSSCIRHIRMLGDRMVVITNYCKQRKMSFKEPTLVVKFLTPELGVSIARYVIFVKELEARVVQHLLKSDVDAETTRTFFCTAFGKTWDPEKFPSLMSEHFVKHGLNLNLHDIRHVLEAFARKLPKSLSTASTLLRTANHSSSSSSSYGRSDEHAEFIDADICEEDQGMCDLWNSKILGMNALTSIPESVTTVQSQPMTNPRKRKSVTDLDMKPADLSRPFVQASACSSSPESAAPAPYPRLMQASTCPLVSQFTASAPSLRPMQASACKFLIQSTKSAILILPTGAGKTRIIQQMMIPSHCDIVLSPYVLLTKQLAEVLGGLRYPCLQSDQNIAANANCIVCALDIVQVNSPLIGLVQTLVSLGRLGTVWYDEAQCLLSRGEFRPKFAEVWSFAMQLAKLNIRPRYPPPLILQ